MGPFSEHNPYLMNLLSGFKFYIKDSEGFTEVKEEIQYIFHDDPVFVVQPPPVVETVPGIPEPTIEPEPLVTTPNKLPDTVDEDVPF